MATFGDMGCFATKQLACALWVFENPVILPRVFEAGLFPIDQKVLPKNAHTKNGQDPNSVKYTTTVGIGAILAGSLVVTVTPDQEKSMDEAVGSVATAHLRVARPTDNLTEVVQFYQDGLGFEVLYEFTDHDGFDGVMLGHQGAAYHLEFTHKRGHIVGRAPSEDNLLGFVSQ